MFFRPPGRALFSLITLSTCTSPFRDKVKRVLPAVKRPQPSTTNYSFFMSAFRFYVFSFRMSVIPSLSVEQPFFLGHVQKSIPTVFQMLSLRACCCFCDSCHAFFCCTLCCALVVGSHFASCLFKTLLQFLLLVWAVSFLEAANASQTSTKHKSNLAIRVSFLRPP